MFLNKKSLIDKWKILYLDKVKQYNSDTEGYFISVFGDILRSSHCTIQNYEPKVNNILDIWFLSKEDAIEFRTLIINEIVKEKEKEIQNLIKINEKN